ncbi:MAG: L-aspartate oxidase [Thermoguttaceae bacterium]
MRYLAPFHPKRHPHFFADVLIIGGGLAGLRAALAVDPRLQVLVLCKGGLYNSNSHAAQGGIACVWAEGDSVQAHVSDTLIAGCGLCDRDVVEHVVSGGPAELRQMREWGAKFDLDSSGEPILTREGGHGTSRILHADGDATGKELIRTVVAEVLQRPNIRIWENTFAIDLLTARDDCRGALVYWHKQGEKELVWAKQTILASGGVGQIYRESTNAATATGDGVAMALRAGATIRDIEFLQFHPTVLYIAGLSRSLITEAMRGEGARLVDRHGVRFMPDYDSRAELAPRDVVSRAIVMQMQKTASPCVFLDLTHREPDWIYKRFPGITEICRSFGIDIARDQIPVRPGMHYTMGGIEVDRNGATSLNSLWAVGEVASTGLHGANRLASNSLLEALVVGAAAGRGASQRVAESGDDYKIEPIDNPPLASSGDTIVASLDLADIRNSLRSLLWREAGIVRNGQQLAEALRDLRRWSQCLLAEQLTTIEGWELQNMLTVGDLILQTALAREESRGAHNREDFPRTAAPEHSRKMIG